MKASTLKLIASVTIGSAALLCGSTSRAVPVLGQYIDDARCDQIPNQVLPDELDEQNIFPINESIRSVPTLTPNFTICVAPDPIPTNDWVVDITNTSGQAWRNLFFVCDHGVTVGNADGNMIDTLNAPGVTTDAFRIDGTVTAGINSNLLAESGIPDEIFAPGETWRFAVSNYMAPNSAGGFSPPQFLTPGVFAGGSNFPNSPGNASILASPVPEPSVVSLIALGAGALLLRRPARRA